MEAEKRVHAGDGERRKAGHLGAAGDGDACALEGDAAQPPTAEGRVVVGGKPRSELQSDADQQRGYRV